MLRWIRFPVAASAVALLTACGDDTSSPDTPAAVAPEPAAATTAAPAIPPLATEAIDTAVAALDVDRFTAHVRQLASDEFGGRAPFTEGERLTVEYLEQAFEASGAGPGNGESYRQAVPLVEITAGPSIPTRVTTPAGEQELAFGSEVVSWTKRVVDSVSVDESQLVFVGYGIVAPEYGWNDYEGVDMAGKTAVILVNDPGFATGDPELFNGRAMTYYGRWTYKYEEAARQGAEAALIVHQTEAAGYPWAVVESSWTGPQFSLAAEDDNLGSVAVEGWLSTDAATAVFSAAGRDFAALAEAASAPGFSPVALEAGVSTTIENAIRRSESANVLARIEGVEAPDEVVIYLAHWDHLGTAADSEGDRIYNGAVDNATGTAALLELAQAFRALPRAPKRSIVFLAVTAEEFGLLGSEHYAQNPVYPTRQTLAGINMDAMGVLGRTQDVVVIGWDASTLQDTLADAAAAQDRTLVPEPTPEKGFFYRSDHFSLAKQGVPVLYAEGGEDVRGKGREFGAAAAADYVANRYHKPSDEYDPSWDLSGTMEDIALYFRIGLSVAEAETWPAWRPGNEFEAARKADLEQ